MSGNKLKELETNKEGIARTDKTNELLGKLLEKETELIFEPQSATGCVIEHSIENIIIKS